MVVFHLKADIEGKAERDEFISEVNEKIEFVEKFKDAGYGIIALKYGFTLQASKEAGVLKYGFTLQASKEAGVLKQDVLV